MKFGLDDFGKDPAHDSKILDILKRNNNISTISILSNLVSNESLEKLKKYEKPLTISIHFNLIDGKALSGKSSLTDDKGRFVGFNRLLLRILLKQIKHQDVINELTSQFNNVNDKITVKKIDSHIHLHAINPISDIVVKFSQDRGLGIRNYNNIETHSFRGVMSKYILLLSAFLYNIIDLKPSLPLSWQGDAKFSFMSWETKVKNFNNDTEYVIHLFSEDDKNTDYQKYLL